MRERELYAVRAAEKEGINVNFNYYFDKITSVFSRFETGPLNPPKKVLFVRNDHIGDMVYSTQIFREVKKAFPKTKIYVLATGSNREIIEKDKNVDEIIQIDQFWKRGIPGFLDYFKVFRKIRKERIDVGIDLRRSKINMFFFLFAPRIPHTASYYNINGGKAFLTNPILCERSGLYLQESIEMINKIFGLHIKDYWPTIELDTADKEDVRRMLKKNHVSKYVVFAPGATDDSKRWPENKFSELIEQFHKKYPQHKVLLSGARSDTALIGRLSRGRPYCVPLINFNLRKMSLIFKNADVSVANDGCGTDISWVSGGKLVTLAGPIDIQRYIPVGKARIIRHKLTSEQSARNVSSMDLITVPEVFSAVQSYMKKRR